MSSSKDNNLGNLGPDRIKNISINDSHETRKGQPTRQWAQNITDSLNTTLTETDILARQIKHFQKGYQETSHTRRDSNLKNKKRLTLFSFSALVSAWTWSPSHKSQAKTSRHLHELLDLHPDVSLEKKNQQIIHI